MNRIFNSCIFGSLSPAQRNVCSTIGTVGGIIAVPSLFVGLYNLSESPHVTNYAVEKYTKSQGKSFPYGDLVLVTFGTVAMIPFSFLTYELIANSKTIYLEDTCCKIIRARLIHCSLVTITSATAITNLLIAIRSFQSIKQYLEE